MTGTAAEWDQFGLKHQLMDNTTTVEFPEYAPEFSSAVKEAFAKERRVPRFDEVDRPAHYGLGKVECIEAIEASMSKEEFKGYLKGNFFKYGWRYGYKGKPVQDLHKARYYLNRLITEVEKENGSR